MKYSLCSQEACLACLGETGRGMQSNTVNVRTNVEKELWELSLLGHQLISFSPSNQSIKATKWPFNFLHLWLLYFQPPECLSDFCMADTAQAKNNQHVYISNNFNDSRSLFSWVDFSSVLSIILYELLILKQRILYQLLILKQRCSIDFLQRQKYSLCGTAPCSSH